jgi:hypothetical protein
MKNIPRQFSLPLLLLTPTVLLGLNACSKAIGDLGNTKEELIEDYNRLSHLSPHLTISQELKDEGMEEGVAGLQKWINERVNFIYRKLDDETLELHLADAAVTNLSRYREMLPEVSLSVVMSNHGSPLYFYGQKLNKNFVPEPGMTIPILGPRIGVLEFGPALFDPDFLPRGDVQGAFANSLSRVSTLVHEARHSDGNGDSLSFKHGYCPSGHDYEYQRVCDGFKNGSYALGGLIEIDLIKACDSSLCTEIDINRMRAEAMDSLNRVATTKKGDGTPVKEVPVPIDEPFRQYNNQ